MKNLKRVGILVAVVSLFMVALSVTVMADAIDDAFQGKLKIGQVVTVGSYNYYYMGDGYFICTTVPTSAVYSSNAYNGWHQADLNKSLNNGTIDLGKTDQGVGIYADTRIAYVTIPNLSDYENLSRIEKGNGPGNYWLCSPYYGGNYGNASQYDWYVGSNGAVCSCYYLLFDGKSVNDVSGSGGVRPAFKLKADFSGSITNNLSQATVFKVIKGIAFTEAVHGELSGTISGLTGSDVMNITVGSGYTVITGTLNTVAIQKITVGSTVLLFKVIDKPVTTSSASVSFSS